MIGKPVPDWAAAESADDSANLSVTDANFYALPFASQMVVWATRKRLKSIAEGAPDREDVSQVFRMADWSTLYVALLAVVDILLRTRRAERLSLHAVSCPCLASHEAYLLNALAHLQAERSDEAILCLCEITTPSGARLAMPHLKVISERVTSQALRFAYVDASSLAEDSPGRTQLRSIDRVH